MAGARGWSGGGGKWLGRGGDRGAVGSGWGEGVVGGRWEVAGARGDRGVAVIGLNVWSQMSRKKMADSSANASGQVCRLDLTSSLIKPQIPFTLILRGIRKTLKQLYCKCTKAVTYV